MKIRFINAGHDVRTIECDSIHWTFGDLKLAWNSDDIVGSAGCKEAQEVYDTTSFEIVDENVLEIPQNSLGCLQVTKEEWVSDFAIEP